MSLSVWSHVPSRGVFGPRGSVWCQMDSGLRGVLVSGVWSYGGSGQRDI